MMNPDDIRQSFLDFFEERDHRIVDSSPVIPKNDPTLLFTNAGMNQFKDVLLGNESRGYDRATSAQKCMRAGGKHNDLDEVGRDGRHLTFFEMLGNWSFGDYWKQQAVEWAWEFVRDVLELERDRLYATVYKDDDESYALWRDVIELDEDRILRLGDIDEGNEENFWSMGPTGPCGPCTEIHYDLRPDEPLDFRPGYDEDRVIEIWNLVFMEFNRDETGQFHPLPMQSVDTGLGLERVAMVKEGVENVFKTGLFKPIFEQTLSLLDEKETTLGEAGDDWESFWGRDDFANFAVIADHIRSLTFSLCDGAQFSNEGRGYVLRRILRRAVRFGRELGFKDAFLCDVTSSVVDAYSDVYPELEATGEEAAELIRLEEERFFRNIDRGIELFEQAADRAEQQDRDRLTGEEVFKLHATYGFPPDLTEIMAEERDLAIDWSGYEKRWEEHQETSKADDVYDEATDVGEWTTVHDREGSTFVGYDHEPGSDHDLLGVTDESLECETVVTRFRPARDASDDDRDVYHLVLEETPFYAEAGGQVGDRGSIESTENDLQFRVTDTQEAPIGIIHTAELVQGAVDRDRLEAPVRARVDRSHRLGAASNHTATHLLHAVLRSQISDSIFQSGSLVAPDRLRFDFSFDRPLEFDEIRGIEDRVNDIIRAGLDVVAHPSVDRDHAVDEMGAMAIFGEEYGDVVRVIDIEDDALNFESIELCGGTHVTNTRDVRLFRVTRESGVAAGIRRIEAVTGQEAYQDFQQDRQTLRRVADALHTEVDHIVDSAESLIEENRELDKHADRLAQKVAHAEARSLAEDAEVIGEVSVVAERVEVETREELRTYADRLREALGEDGVALLGAEVDGSAALICLVTDSVVGEFDLSAGDLVAEAAEQVGGGGGGRPTMAQAGGPNADAISNAIETFLASVRTRLNG